MKIVVEQSTLYHPPGQLHNQNYGSWTEREYKVIRLVDRIDPEIGTVFSEDGLQRLIRNVRYDDLFQFNTEVEII